MYFWLSISFEIILRVFIITWGYPSNILVEYAHIAVQSWGKGGQPWLWGGVSWSSSHKGEPDMPVPFEWLPCIISFVFQTFVLFWTFPHWSYMVKLLLKQLFEIKDDWHDSVYIKAGVNKSVSPSQWWEWSSSSPSSSLVLLPNTFSYS